MQYQLFYLSIMYFAVGKIMGTTGDQTDTELKAEEKNDEKADGVCDNIQPIWTDIFLPLQKPREEKGILDSLIRSINPELGTEVDGQLPQVCDVIREEDIEEQDSLANSSDDSDDESSDDSSDDSDDESSDDDSDDESS